LAETESNELFSFDVGEASSIDTAPVVELAGPNPEDLHKALIAAGDAAYRWNILTDQISWSTNAAEILGCPVSYISTGKQYAQLLDLDNFSTRYDTVMNAIESDNGAGVPFQIEYVFRSEGRSRPKTVWIEDQGRWFAGPNGKPREVYGTVRRIDERHKREQRLNFLGNCDPLTGMMNRGKLGEALSDAIAVASRENSHCAFAIASVNNLDVVNDAYGFEVADEVIVALGRKLRQVMRAGDAIARYSGGKFGFILNNCAETDLKVLLERLLETVRDSVIETDHGPVWAMLSIGAVCLPEFASSANVATSLAEEALNEACKLPSDGYVIHKHSERRQSERRLNARCAAEIVTCLKEERFKLAFQPIVSAQTRDIVMHEALLRMAEGSGSELIAASHLVPIAEQLGLVRLVDRSVTQLILQTLHQYPSARLSMNISGTTAMDPRWHNQLLETISDSKLAENRLIVEITETVAINDLASTRRFVEQLREAGCGVAIDDFGAGFTSFKNLRELPISMVKIDGAYCRNLAGNRENAFIVRNLIDLGRNFNLTTVAEWIETEEDAELLKSWGIDYLQGNLISEASIDIPWPKGTVATFDLATGEMGDIEASGDNLSAIDAPASSHFNFNEPQAYEVILPAVKQSIPMANEIAVVASHKVVEPNAAAAEPAAASIKTEMEPAVELEFSDIDASIASLKAAMALFSPANTSATHDEDHSAA
jgi:diguanylate cyclase (GGDEF)-like protein